MKAVAFHKRGSEFGDDRWELYHVDEDFSEAHDLAEQHPHKLRELVDAWWVEARRNKVLPLEDRGFAERANVKFRPHSPRDRARFVYRSGMQHIGTGAAPPIAGRSFESAPSSSGREDLKTAFSWPTEAGTAATA